MPPDCLSAGASKPKASNLFFRTWSGRVACRFAERDRSQVPDHRTYFAVRRSPIARGSPRAAADPLNAMLNYSYALAEAECSDGQHAWQVVGLDPGLGIVHRRHFTRRDFHETPAGACRILAPLTHELADAISL